MSKKFVCCQVVIFAVSSSMLAFANEDEFAMYDRCCLEISKYDEALRAATAIRDEGLTSRDSALEARGLIRLAFAELYFGKWGEDWEANRNRALELSSELPSPNIARSETLMFHGYLQAMYLKEPEQGVDSLHEAISIARALQDDALLSKCYSMAAAVLPLQGRVAIACDYAYRSIRFAEVANASFSEAESIQLVLFHDPEISKDDHKKYVERLKILSEEYDFVPYYSVEPINEPSLRLYVQRAIESIDQPVNENVVNLQNGLAASLQLLERLVNEKRWESVPEFTDIAIRLAKKVQNEQTQEDLKVFQAIGFILDGELDKVDEFVVTQMKGYEKEKQHRIIADAYQMFAACAKHVNEDTRALEWMTESAKHRRLMNPTGHSKFSANSFFESEMKARALRNTIANRDQSIVQQRYLVGALLLCAIVVWFGYRVRQSRIQRVKLQEQVRQRTASLEDAKGEAERANKAKNDFLARINHELRNPLTSIITSCELIDERPIGQETDPEIDRTLRASTRHLLDLIDDVLDFTKIESGKLELRENSFSIIELLDSVRLIVRQHCNPDVELKIKCADGVPEGVVADEAKLRQTLVNLGVNSAQNTLHGKIQIECKLEDCGGPRLAFSVSDTGRGIDEERLSNIFDTYSTDRGHGTGLGLHIGAAFVSLMGGKIDVVSKVGVGSTFSFSIPVISAANDKSAIVNDQQVIEGYTVLVVDDEELIRIALQQLLELLGHTGFVAQSWPEAKEILANERIDVILLDLRMPEMDGFEMSKRIAELLGDAVPPMYAITGDATSETRRRIESHVFSGMLPKPFLSSQLQDVIQRKKKSGVF